MLIIPVILLYRVPKIWFHMIHVLDLAVFQLQKHQGTSPNFPFTGYLTAKTETQESFMYVPKALFSTRFAWFDHKPEIEQLMVRVIVRVVNLPKAAL